jgi:hypothetical protein
MNSEGGSARRGVGSGCPGERRNERRTRLRDLGHESGLGHDPQPQDSGHGPNCPGAIRSCPFGSMPVGAREGGWRAGRCAGCCAGCSVPCSLRCSLPCGMGCCGGWGTGWSLGRSVGCGSARRSHRTQEHSRGCRVCHRSDCRDRRRDGHEPQGRMQNQTACGVQSGMPLCPSGNPPYRPLSQTVTA